MLNNTPVHAVRSMHAPHPTLHLPLRRPNAHDPIRLIFAQPRLLRLAQNALADVVEEMANNNQREGNGVEPVDVQVEDVESDNYALDLDVSRQSFKEVRTGPFLISRSAGILFPQLTQKLPVKSEMLKKAALASRYKMGTIV